MTIHPRWVSPDAPARSAKLSTYGSFLAPLTSTASARARAPQLSGQRPWPALAHPTRGGCSSSSSTLGERRSRRATLATRQTRPGPSKMVGVRHHHEHWKRLRTHVSPACWGVSTKHPRKRGRRERPCPQVPHPPRSASTMSETLVTKGAQPLGDAPRAESRSGDRQPHPGDDVVGENHDVLAHEATSLRISRRFKVTPRTKRSSGQAKVATRSSSTAPPAAAQISSSSVEIPGGG